MLRTGTSRRRREDPGWNPTAGRPGWHAECLPWFAEREVAVVAAAINADVAAISLTSEITATWPVGRFKFQIWFLRDEPSAAFVVVEGAIGVSEGIQ